jgi:FAD/FMN-containing dehydrogenase
MSTADISSSTTDALARSIAGRVTGRRDEDHAAAAMPWNMHEQQPALVVEAASAEDVATTVAFAAQHGLRVVAQPTGHSSTSSFEDAVLIRTRGLNGVELAEGGAVARAGAGALWREVQAVAVPAGRTGLMGTAPHVSATGYTLGGGISWLGSPYGLGANRLLAADVVDAEGRVRRVDAEHEPELLFALRGGGGNYGIVTGVELGLVELATVFAGVLAFPLPRVPEVLPAWRDWVRGVPRELTSIATILRVPDMPTVPEPLRGAELIVIGACHAGPDAEGEAAIAPLRDLGPIMDTFGPMAPDGLGVLHNDPEDPMPDIGGACVLGDVDDATMARLIELAGPDSDTPLLFVELRHMGGAFREPVVSGGAYDRVEGEFLLHALGVPMGPRAGEIPGAIAALRDAVAPAVTGRPPLNFCHTAEEATGAFDPATLERLRAVKRSVDPDGMFLSSHPIGG